MNSRSCAGCTKCCEGWLTGEALGQTFYPGKPCHFISIGKGCSVYAKRPKEPCQSFKCAWLIDKNIPEWMKPSDINTILTYKEINGIPYLSVIEAGSVLSAKVLTWVIQYALSNKINLYWQVEGGTNWVGSPEFNQAIQEESKYKTLHPKSNLLPLVSEE